MKVYHIDNKKKIMPDPWTDLPSSFLLVGMSKSGKTNVVANMLLDIYKNKFDRLITFCPTADLDPIHKKINTRLDADVFDYPDDDAIRAIIQLKNEEAKGENWVIFVDDCLGYTHSNDSELTKLFTKGRHYKISVILCSQSWKSIAPTARVNASMCFLFGTKSKEELKKMTELAEGVDEKTFERLFRGVTSVPYTPLIIVKVPSKSLELFRGFDGEKCDI